MGVLDGKVVLITGGGNGIGRECALLAAKEGAAVLVNDLGGSVSGKDDAGSAGPAEKVAQEIRTAGGKAIFNSESVTNYDAVVDMREQALKELGGLHAIINPAGILRDGMFHKMNPDDWKAVIDVHLHGAFNVCRATVELFREQQEGSFVLFTSTSGLIGNLGQANYAAAKLGVMGLSRVLAMEGAQKNVRSNIIAPFAMTRMIDTIPVKDEASAQRVERMRRTMRADQVAQVAVALAAPGPKAPNGQIFMVRGNEVALYTQPRPIRTLGRLEGWTPESLIEQCFPAMSSTFTDLGNSSTIFPYDPV